jgi:hypothetical protein
MSSRSKVSKELTPEELVEMIDTLAKTPGGHVLRVIQAEAKKRGLDISPMAATSFRDSELMPHLEKLKRCKVKSTALAEAMIEGDETGLLASNRMLLAEKISDLLLSDDFNAKQISGLALSLQMLSGANQGDKKTQAALDLSNAKLREYEAKEADRKEKAAKLEKQKAKLTKKGGLSDEAIALMEEAIGLMS